jgi:hypothetical protein
VFGFLGQPCQKSKMAPLKVAVVKWRVRLKVHHTPTREEGSANFAQALDGSVRIILIQGTLSPGDFGTLMNTVILPMGALLNLVPPGWTKAARLTDPFPPLQG